MRTSCHMLIAGLLVLSPLASGAERSAQDMLSWESLPPLSGQGGAGPFVGIHNDTLIVAGGTNFPVKPGKDLW
jgi:SSS family solute:Na+ symporter